MDAVLRPVLATFNDAAAADAGRVLRPVSPAFTIREERPRDTLAREALLDRSFGLGRFAKTCERLREGRDPAEALSFVAVAGSRIVGTLRFWHVEAGDRPSLLLGPLAVDAAHRSLGIGGAMIANGLARARQLGHGSVILVGDAPYYARFGFHREPVASLLLPGPVELDRFLGLEITPGALSGASGRVSGTGRIVERRGAEEFRRAA